MRQSILKTDYRFRISFKFEFEKICLGVSLEWQTLLKYDLCNNRIQTESVFGPVKTKWRSVLNDHCKANGFKDVAKHHFPALMKNVVENSFQKKNARSGFEAAVLFQLNRVKILNIKLQIGIFSFKH